MAQEYSRQEIISSFQALLPSNGQELIAATDVQEALLILLYSTYNKVDDNINNNFTTSTWNSSLPYPVNFIVEYQSKFWKSKIANNTNIPPVEGASWTEVSKAEAGQNINLANFFTKLELLTAGQSQVHWDNITNVPALGGGTSSHTETLNANKTLQAPDATYQFLDPNGANRTITLDTVTSIKAFVIKNTGTSFYLNVLADSQNYAVAVGGMVALVWDGSIWQEI
jgi:hypothetical protein